MKYGNKECQRFHSCLRRWTKSEYVKEIFLQRAMDRTIERRAKQKLGLLSTFSPGSQINTTADQPGVEALKGSYPGVILLSQG